MTCLATWQPQTHLFLLVTDLSLASARDTIRLIAFIAKQAPHVNISIAVNKVETGAHNEVSTADFSHSVEMPISWLVPLDKKSSLEATKLGKPIVQALPRSKVSVELQNIASHFCGVESAQGKEGFFDKLKKGVKS